MAIEESTREAAADDTAPEVPNAPDTGPDAESDTGPVAGIAVPAASEGERPPLPRWLIAALAGALVLVLAGAGLLVAAHQERTGAAGNKALTDRRATAQVTGEVSSALAKIFSYTPKGTAATERSAREVLGGKAAGQYEELFGKLRARVAEQRITLTTEVVRAGVAHLDGGSAQLLVYLDQSARRGKEKPSHAAAQLAVTARLQEGQWRIVDLAAR
ncbi:hypothetical protein [Streptomyces sp. SCSIO ZS0520]|uniref:hypothetical protein n=1 Tax=Streptomyces sp. SCSIO ZS0520 TaxID=2892996 RepID=UPI0021D99F32|nr:hypothetical protein [Streptomyces sp. SCSIO ZS0520]